jgi:hypothetical protein
MVGIANGGSAVVGLTIVFTVYVLSLLLAFENHCEQGWNFGPAGTLSRAIIVYLPKWQARD